MKTRRFSLALTVAFPLVLAFVYWLTPMGRTGMAAPGAADDAPFRGKFLLVFLDSKYSLPLEQAHVRKVGEVSFLVGKGSEDLHGHHWAKNRTVWLPMSRVEMITEFTSVDEMKKAWKEALESMPPDPFNAPPPPPNLPKEDRPRPKTKD